MFQVKRLCRLLSIYPFQIPASYFSQVIPYSGMPLHGNLYVRCLYIVPQAVQFIALDSFSLSSIHLLSADESQILKVLIPCEVFLRRQCRPLEYSLFLYFSLHLEWESVTGSQRACSYEQWRHRQVCPDLAISQLRRQIHSFLYFPVPSSFHWSPLEWFKMIWIGESSQNKQLFQNG